MTSPKNILADRYASPPMKKIWEEETRILLERQFWLTLAKAQQSLGLPIPQEALTAYEKVQNTLDLSSIRSREEKCHHDVKARLDEFSSLASQQHIHKGLTSRDLTESVEQLQIYRSLTLILDKAVACLSTLSTRAKQYQYLPLVARTHNVPAQIITFGKRLAMFGEEMLYATQHLEYLLKNYPARGLKGAVGTQLDLSTLFEGNTKKVEDLEETILSFLGLTSLLTATGQVYPRSLDYEVISGLYQLGSAPVSFAKTLRLMAGEELADEGFSANQVGSSAMPHKKNCRSCERISGFQVLLQGYLTMASSLAGDQWNEGDVSCSVVRRVMLPDSFFVIDGLLETFLTVLLQMKVQNEVMEEEVKKYLPLLSSTTILMRAVQAGMGREEAHAIIQKASVGNLIEHLDDDERFPLKKEKLLEILSQARERGVNAAAVQVTALCKKIDSFTERFPDSTHYKPEPLL